MKAKMKENADASFKFAVSFTSPDRDPWVEASCTGFSLRTLRDLLKKFPRYLLSLKQLLCIWACNKLLMAGSTSCVYIGTPSWLFTVPLALLQYCYAVQIKMTMAWCAMWGCISCVCCLCSLSFDHATRFLQSSRLFIGLGFPYDGVLHTDTHTHTQTRAHTCTRTHTCTQHTCPYLPMYVSCRPWPLGGLGQWLSIHSAQVWPTSQWQEQGKVHPPTVVRPTWSAFNWCSD